jgi:hypothetical protein
MRLLELQKCSVVLTVGTIVDMEKAEETLHKLCEIRPFKRGSTQDFGGWTPYRPKERFGVHPDAVFDVGRLPGALGVIPEFFLRSRLYMEQSQKALPGGDVVESAIREALLGHGYPTPEEITTLVRLLPSGIGTLSVRFNFESIEGEKLSEVLSRVDPRRHPAATPPAPDLAVLLNARIREFAGGGWLAVEDRGGATCPLGMADLGNEMRARIPPPAALDHLAEWQRPETEQRPYTFVSAIVPNDEVWAEKPSEEGFDLHRQLFHIVAGPWVPYGSPKLRVPSRYMEGQRLKSPMWSTDVIAAVCARGAGMFRQAGANGNLPDPHADAYLNSALDVSEQLVGTWSALGTLGVMLDRKILDLRSQVPENLEPLRMLAKIRRLLIRVLAEPLSFELEGSSLNDFAAILRGDLEVDALRESLFSRLREARELHELHLHIEAVEQIMREHA